jgi:hypothetical protein
VLVAKIAEIESRVNDSPRGGLWVAKLEKQLIALKAEWAELKSPQAQPARPMVAA